MEAAQIHIASALIANATHANASRASLALVDAIATSDAE